MKKWNTPQLEELDLNKTAGPGWGHGWGEPGWGGPGHGRPDHNRPGCGQGQYPGYDDNDNGLDSLS